MEVPCSPCAGGRERPSTGLAFGVAPHSRFDRDVMNQMGRAPQSGDLPHFEFTQCH